jgi:hypothetical protein
MRDVHDTDTIEELLVRSGDYLMERTTQYREQPARTSVSRQGAPLRHRRVLVGTAAAATLGVTALAGSFIGGTSSGTVDVAEAAWSAIPATPTAEQVEKVQLDCGITVNTLATIESVPPASIPDHMLEPALVDVRGTTTTAVYFTWTQATLCVQFGDGSIQVPQIPMVSLDEFAWQEPTALDLLADISATMIVGFLPPNISAIDPRSTSESDTVIESQWEAYVDGPGVERTKASVNAVMGRYVAWVPTTGNFRITFVNSLTGEERVVGATTGTLGWQAAPVTTIVEQPTANG